jgi:hypothetical protein
MKGEFTMYSDWEYHPVYGCYSRIIFIATKDGWEITGREYKHLDITGGMRTDD